VETSKAIVLPEDELLYAQGWIVHYVNLSKYACRCAQLDRFSDLEFRPRQPMSQRIFLLTRQAYYLCEYDYQAEKVAEYKRVKLIDVVAIQKGKDFHWLRKAIIHSSCIRCLLCLGTGDGGGRQLCTKHNNPQGRRRAADQCGGSME
jgi:hypothetical protein